MVGPYAWFAVLPLAISARWFGAGKIRTDFTGVAFGVTPCVG
jgi:hypothetical protein